MDNNHSILKNIYLCTVFSILLITNTAVGLNDQPLTNHDMSDLDEFMAKVMQKRSAYAENLRDYVFSERETLEVKVGTKIAAQWSYRREYLWFVRDDSLVRSPVMIDGVKVSDKEKSAAEEEWINGQKRLGDGDYKNSIDNKTLFGFENETSLDFQVFFGFEFQPGRYLYGGTRQFEGREAVLVEYYPRTSDWKNGGNKDDIRGLFAKSFLVTMLISPEEHQILQITFDNVGLGFLPARWFVRMNDIKASMIMDKQKDDVWLPREIIANGSVSTAASNLSINYSRKFYEYAKSDVNVTIRFGDGDVEPEQ